MINCFQSDSSKSLMRFLAWLFLPMCAFGADNLQVVGNKIVYGNREVMLQGVAVGDPLLGREGRPLSDYDTIAHDWNANVVRISIHPGIWRDFGRRKVLEVLHENVNAALNAGIFVIITWHVIGVPDAYMQQAPDGYVHDLYDSNFKLAKDFWWHVSEEFGHDGRIMFELWNEPAWPKQDDGSHLQPKWLQLKPYWQELAQLIRYQSANLIIVTSGSWGYNLQGVSSALLTDGNVAYAWHIYANTDNNDPAAWERNLDGLAYVKPIIVTEWGFETDKRASAYNGGAASYGYLFANRFLKDKHLHYTAWCWHSVWRPNMLELDWKTPTAYGRFIKEIQWRTQSIALIRP